jgi:hypothetical protein
MKPRLNLGAAKLTNKLVLQHVQLARPYRERADDWQRYDHRHYRGHEMRGMWTVRARSLHGRSTGKAKPMHVGATRNKRANGR